MSGTGDFVSTIQELRKQFYDKDAQEDVFQRPSAFAERVASAGRKVNLGGLGLNIKMAIRNATGAVVSTLTEAGSYPSPGFQSGVTPTMTCVHMVAAVGWTGHVLAMGTSAEASFQRGTVIKQNLTDLKEKLKRTIARLLMWSGTAILGITAAASGTTGGYITLASGSAPINFFEPGDYLTLRTATSGGTEKLTNAATGAGRILNVQDDLATPRIILTDASGATAGGGDYVAWANVYDTTVIDGILAMISNTGTYMGLDRSTGANAALRALVIDNGGASLTPTSVDELRDRVAVRAELRSHKDYKPAWVGNHNARRSVIQSTIGQVRFTGLSKQEVGTPTIAVNDKDGETEFIADSYMLEKTIVRMDPRDVIMGAPEGMEGGQMVENAGSPIFQVPGTGTWTDAYRSYMTWRGQYDMTECRTAGKLNNFTPSA